MVGATVALSQAAHPSLERERKREHRMTKNGKGEKARYPMKLSYYRI